MGTVTGLTADRMLEIEGASVVGGRVEGDLLILTKHDGSEVQAGNVRGGQGNPGPPGSITASPAGGSLKGNYPNPGIADGAITDVHVAGANKDGAVDLASMRTLGTGSQQAAAGNHKHGDTGWIDVSPSAGGDAPFGTKAVVYLQYRRFGPMVHVRMRKDSAGTIDRSTATGGNFPNVAVLPPGSLPAAARPDTNSVQGAFRMADSPQGVTLSSDGAVYWVGGFPRNYQGGLSMIGDFVFMTSAT